MVVFELLADIALAFEDVLVGLTLLGSSVLLAWTTVNGFRTWRTFPPDVLHVLTLLGWFAAASCLGGVIIVDRHQTLGGIVLHLSVLGTIALLALVVLMLLAAKWLDRLGDRRRLPYPPTHQQ